MDSDVFMADYLARLDSAALAAGVPDERRAELLSDVREHLELAMADLGPDPDLDAIVARLGSPEEIIDAETAVAGPRTAAEVDGVPVAPIATSPEPWHLHVSTESKALLWLAVGGVILPFVGPLVGLWFVWSSRRWTHVQRRTATVAVLLLLALPAVIVGPLLVAGELTAVINNFGPVLTLIPLAGLLTAAYLAIVLHIEILVVERRHP